MQNSASPEVREALRELVSRVEVHPGGEDGTGPTIELIGHLGALLRAGGADVPAMCLGSVKVDAGTGFGLWRTRLSSGSFRIPDEGGSGQVARRSRPT